MHACAQAPWLAQWHSGAALHHRACSKRAAACAKHTAACAKHTAARSWRITARLRDPTRAVAARAGALGWPRGAECLQGGQCGGSSMARRQPECNGGFVRFFAREAPLPYCMLLRSLEGNVLRGGRRARLGRCCEPCRSGSLY